MTGRAVLRPVAGAAGVVVTAAAVLVITVAGLGASTAAASPVPAPRRVLLVVVPEVTWASAPSSLAGWAKASLALNSVSRQRAIDVYLTLGKGRRTGGPAEVAGVGPVEVDGGGLSFGDWSRFEQRDRRLRYGGRLGELGQLLEDHGVPVAVVGPSAEVAAVAADHHGRVGRFVVGGPDEAVTALGSARLVIVQVDRGEVEHLVRATGGTCRILTSASAPPDDVHLGVMAVSPECGLGRSGLVSPSTRQPGFVTLTDLAPTVLSLVGVAAPNGFEGGVVRAAQPTTVGRLIAEDHRAMVSRAAGRPITGLFFLAAAFGLLGVVRERWRLRIAAVLLGMPPALLLMMTVPWWRHGRLAGAVALLAVAGLLAGVTLATVGRDPARVVLVLTTVTAAVIALDALHRGTLELDAPMVNNAIGAGRFAGVGNVPSGFLVAAAIAAAAVVLDRHPRLVPAVAAGLAFTVVADGAPMFGADAGGALASVAAVATLLLARRGRLRWRALAAAFAAGVCAVAGLAAWEISRPAARRTHLGRALTGGSAAETLLRRGLSALGSFRSSPWLLVTVVAVVGLVALRRRLPTGAALRAGAAATGVAAVIGTAANDSGVAVGGAILFVAWAAALALAQPGGGAAVPAPAATAGSSR